MSSGLRAVVLCAGEGRRLRPLTSFLPKPLLPVAGRSLLERTLGELAAVGCEAVAVNLHHLGDRIRKRFESAHAGMPITYSEEPELLGTLGALGPLREFMAAARTVLVVNGDSLCRWPFKRLLRQHARRRADVSLLAAARADAARFGGGLLAEKDGTVVALRGGPPAEGGRRRLVFAGAHVFAPELLDRVPLPSVGEPADLVSGLWEPLMEAGGRLTTVPTRRRWHDLGTPERYLSGVLDFVRGTWPARAWRRRWLAGGAEIRGRARRSVLESGARAESGSRVTDSLLFPGAVAGSGSEIVRGLLGPGAVLPGGAAITGRMVTAARSDVPVLAGDSVVGGMVYSRLDAAARED